MAFNYYQTLTCVDSNLALDAFTLDAASLDVGHPAAWSVRKYTLRGGLQEGVDLIEIDNGQLRFAVLPTRGMGILRAEHQGQRLGWDSPVKTPVHPAFINLQERGGLGWLKGFNEWVVRCGLSSMGAPGPDAMIDNNGNPAIEQLPLHGKIANLPAHKVSLQITGQEIILRGEVDETMLFGPALRLTTEIRTAFGSHRLDITDTVTNLGAQPTEHQLLYHVNYGSPLLEENARFLCPIREMAPRDPRATEGLADFARFNAPVCGFVEQCYFFELLGEPETGQTLAMLRNAAGNRASVLRFSLAELPAFTLWKNTGAPQDGYVTGLEPATAYPNNRQFERSQNRVITLAPGQSRRTSLAIEALDSSEAVQAAELEIHALQQLADPSIHQQPIPRFSNI